MSKRFLWLLGVVVLFSIALLVACGSNYNSSTQGLLLVGSQGSALIETFGFNLSNGNVSAISNTPDDTISDVCVLPGVPSSMVVDPAGTYAYAILNQNPACPKSKTGIAAFKVNSDGTTTAVGGVVSFQGGVIVVQGQVPPNTPENVNVVPSSIAIDAAGKFLFVADRATTDIKGNFVPGSVSVFAISGGGSIKEVAGSPFFTTTPPMTTATSSLDIVSVAPTPTVFPAIGVNGTQNSVCSTPGLPTPTKQYLYAVDALGNQVFEFSVNTSTGVLGNPGNGASVPLSATDQTPAGVAVDPCNRFVYVSDGLTNKVSAYAICNGSATSPTQPCSRNAPGFLDEISGSPFSLSGSANGPDPLVVDPYGNNVYVLGTLSNTVSPLKISPVSGSLSALTPATVATGSGPVSMTIRADDNWLFVANYGNSSLGGSTISQFSVVPATGALSALPAIATDNYPFGVAVK